MGKPPQTENMVSIRKWGNQTLKLRKVKQFFYRKRRVAFAQKSVLHNPPYVPRNTPLLILPNTKNRAPRERSPVNLTFIQLRIRILITG